jgi:hypothetical protein
MSTHQVTLFVQPVLSHTDCFYNLLSTYLPFKFFIDLGAFGTIGLSILPYQCNGRTLRPVLIQIQAQNCQVDKLSTLAKFRSRKEEAIQPMLYSEKSLKQKFLTKSIRSQFSMLNP